MTEADILTLISRGVTLLELTRRYDTTLTAFCEWMGREHVQYELDKRFQQALAAARDAAIRAMPTVEKALKLLGDRPPKRTRRKQQP